MEHGGNGNITRSKRRERGSVLAVLAALIVLAAAPQQDAGLTASICELLKGPRRFSGQLVTVRARVLRSPEFHALVDTDDEKCGQVTLQNPEERRVDPKPAFGLVRDSNNELFEKVTLRMLGNSRTDVYATLEGRFDSVFWPWQGYGHLNQFKARLVLRRVLKVETTQ